MSGSISRSAKLRKYEVVYDECVKKASLSKKASIKQPKKSVNKSVKAKKPNLYQQFVKDESKKPKYSDMTNQDRMKAIGKAWSDQK